jgi:hypothetical protein
MKRFRFLATAAFLALAIPAAYAAQHATPERMQQRFQQMQTMMDQMAQAKTPTERQKLMAEHRQMMQEQMVAMHDMTGPGGMMGKDQGAGTMDPNAQMQMMQRRMDMMQQMMEQMMEQMMQQHLMTNPAQ